jgi:hypothetical protein
MSERGVRVERSPTKRPRWRTVLQHATSRHAIRRDRVLAILEAREVHRRELAKARRIARKAAKETSTEAAP